MLPRIDVKKTFMTTTHSKETTVDLAHQATKFPVFKNVRGLWHFYYAAAERQRFTATEMWEPNRLPIEAVDQYLQALSLNWGPKSGLTEELALKYLQMHGYSIERALKETIYTPKRLKVLIHEASRLAEKIETIAFIGSLLDEFQTF